MKEGVEGGVDSVVGWRIRTRHEETGIGKRVREKEWRRKEDKSYYERREVDIVQRSEKGKRSCRERETDGEGKEGERRDGERATYLL